ncbi:hypothetical protein [Actinophytocola gossypii]|uniref:Integral membrane protein n=1 Tax=Actinophytocola gossypii TaxID=2812003 RepID=A0ABT2J710_9PSEU|nr:hypothetical protein [Actinophytocola gossypii]MCT2583647.1 hypothetical protein [Actinophytocola gossypii]
MLRTAFATLFVLLGCLLAGPAVAAFVLVEEITDQESYLDAVAPLADDPEVRTAVADQLSAAVDGSVPEAARQLVDQSITSFVESDRFRPTWVELNREAHPQVLGLLRDDGGGLAVEGDAVVLDLGVVATDLKARFVADGVPLADRIPEIDAQVELMSGPAVRQAVPSFELLEQLSIWLPVAAIGLIVLGLVLSARRGTTLVVTGFGLVVVMLLMVLARWFLRSELAARSPSPELAGPFYDALTSTLSVVLWVVCAIGGVFVIVGGIIAQRASRRAR